MIGVPGALLFGLLTVLLRFVPYVGTWIAAVLAMMLAAAVGPGWSMLVWTVALFGITDAIARHVVEPMLWKHSTGLSPLAVIVAAIVGLTRTLAHEAGADGIRVNCVMPGAIHTERQSRLWYTDEYKKKILQRQALKIDIQPEDVAKLVLFLASDESRAITNQSFIVDAGWV